MRVCVCNTRTKTAVMGQQTSRGVVREHIRRVKCFKRTRAYTYNWINIARDRIIILIHIDRFCLIGECARCGAPPRTSAVSCGTPRTII